MKRCSYLLLSTVLVLGTLRSAIADETPRTVTPLKPGEHLVGQRLPALTFKGIDWRTLDLKPLKPPAVGTVIALTNTSCPICQKYGKALGRVERAATAKGFRFVYLNPAPFDEVADMKRDHAAFGWKGPYVHDPDAELARALGALTTADVFVVDASGTLVYRGPVDDQHGISSSLPEPRTPYLVNALKSVLADEPVKDAALWAPGCVLDLEPPERAEPGIELVGGITYHNRISRILQANCVRCHREGGGAPFALETYEQVVNKKGMIGSVVEDGIMPPWFAKPGHVVWSNDATLPEADREDLLAWLDSDRPEGDPADAPLSRDWPADWAIGAPDRVFRLPRPVKIKAEGVMDYVNVRVPTGFKEDKWVQAIELRPTDPTVVHHALVFVRAPRKPVGGSKKKARDWERDGLRRALLSEGGFFAGYVPGNNKLVYPKGMAKFVPAGATLHFQMHYTPNGKATTDQAELGIRFADAPPKREVFNVPVQNHRIRIPAGAANHRETARKPVPFPVRLLSFMPHMHVRGKAFKYEIVEAGKRTTLLDIPAYDFNWQLNYLFAEPYPVPAGSRIECEAHFDNSAANPANPNPRKTVRWGEQTDDEMLIGYVEFVLDSE